MDKPRGYIFLVTNLTPQRLYFSIGLDQRQKAIVIIFDDDEDHLKQVYPDFYQNYHNDLTPGKNAQIISPNHHYMFLSTCLTLTLTAEALKNQDYVEVLIKLKTMASAGNKTLPN